MAKKLRKIPVTREQVLASGTRFEMIVCPICVKSVKLTRYNGERARFDKFDFEKTFIDVRYGGGLASGFYRSDEESMTLEEAIKTQDYGDLIQQLKSKCQEIIDKIDAL